MINVMEVITIGIIWFMAGTLISLYTKKPVNILICFTFGYIYLIIGSWGHYNAILLGICLILNIIGIICVVLLDISARKQQHQF